MAIAVDASGSAYVAGYTYSTDLPVAGAIQTRQCRRVRRIYRPTERNR